MTTISSFELTRNVKLCLTPQRRNVAGTPKIQTDLEVMATVSEMVQETQL